MAEVQKDLVAINLVFIRRVIVKAVLSESFVLELNKTQRWNLGLDFYTPRDFTWESVWRTEAPATTPGRWALSLCPALSHHYNTFLCWQQVRTQPHFKMTNLAWKLASLFLSHSLISVLAQTSLGHGFMSVIKKHGGEWCNLQIVPWVKHCTDSHICPRIVLHLQTCTLRSTGLNDMTPAPVDKNTKGGTRGRKQEEQPWLF